MEIETETETETTVDKQNFVSSTQGGAFENCKKRFEFDEVIHH